MDETEELVSELRRGIQGEVRCDPVSRMLYRTDASIYEMEPLGVVVPVDAQDVVRSVEIAARHRVPLVPRGSGTSLGGQAVGRGLHVDFSKHMNRILELDARQKWVRVQPGVVLDQLNRYLKPHGLVFGPDVATSSRANLGGMIGNNSSGAHSLLYGKTVDHVLELQVVLSDGSLATFGPMEPGMLQARSAGDDLEGRIYRQVARLVAENRDEIARTYPRVMRRVSGYNLDELTRRDAPFNLSKVVVGSEGTLCLVVEARLNLVELPARTGLVACHFSGLAAAMEANLVALETGPAAVELTDRILLDQTRNSLEHAPKRRFLQGDPEALLFVEYYADATAAIEARMDELEAALCRRRLGYAFVRALDPAQQKGMWELRKAGLGLLMGMRGDAKPVAGLEDTCVPVAKLPEYVDRVQALMAQFGVPCVFYAHASVGVLHIRPVLNLKDPGGIRVLRQLEDRVSDMVREYGGAMSAEHGDGLARSEWIPKMFGERMVRVFEQVKDAFDPQGIMNPGKIVRPGRMDEDLRHGPHYHTAAVETYFRFRDEGGLQRAVELCSGVGHCRKTQVGTMCPSYMATLEEEHSTRGRANALRAALSGNLDARGLASDQLFEVMDLCLECKACKGECPSSVDMAKLKYEFLAHYYEEHGYPLRARLFGRIDLISRWASALAPASNWIGGMAPNRWILDRFVGIDRRRQLPRFTRRRFSRWFRRRPLVSPRRGPVVLFHDTYAEYSEPHIGVAATRILERAGFEVVLAEDKVCCGRPLISKGFLRQARENARHNLAVLAPFARQGWPILGLEPSCLLTLRDDYLDLVDDPRAQEVADQAFLLEEFLGRLADQGELGLTFTDAPRRILVHGHCQQKALTGIGPTLRVLNLPANWRATEIDSGCCGLAGSFGYEKEHYEISMRVGEERLFAAIRAADPGTEIVAAGTSCRHQIAHGTGRTARHWAEVLAEAL
ncbi:MAG: FAD-linked oxidase C-terminal domain-containing protein [Candidatus Latescibacterota bacterium]